MITAATTARAARVVVIAAVLIIVISICSIMSGDTMGVQRTGVSTHVQAFSLQLRQRTGHRRLRPLYNNDRDFDTFDDTDNDDDLECEDFDYEDLCAAVIVPGFLTGAEEFRPLANELTRIGLPTIPLPMPNWHWLPCLGGRSARPILERIEYTVKWLIANDGDITKTIPSYQYSLKDVFIDFRTNPGGVAQVGGSSKVDEYPINVTPQGKFVLPHESDLLAEPSANEEGGDIVDDDVQMTKKKKKRKRVAIIAHSAGGWISRVFLSTRSYGGKTYDGSKLVHTLITLGTPHANAPGPAFEGIVWINNINSSGKQGNKTETDQASHLGPVPSPVRSLAVAGTGYAGGEWGALTQSSYSFCCPEGTDGRNYDGDGVTPVFSALAFEDAEPLLLEGVSHFAWSDVFGGSFVAPELTKDHESGRPWYGSPEIVHTWAKFILDYLPTCRVKRSEKGN